MPLLNDLSPQTLDQQSVFELFETCQGQKQLFLHNEKPLKYAAIVRGSSLEFQVETQKSGSELEMILLCPIRDEKELSVNVLLNLNHDDCQIKLHLVALVFTNAKTTLNAAIAMKPKIQRSASSLLEETVVLSPQVQLASLPILDIHAKNIQASHGAKIYRLDEEKLFYLQSKGLSRRGAEQLLLASYEQRLMEDIPLMEEEKSELMSDFLAFIGKE